MNGRTDIAALIGAMQEDPAAFRWNDPGDVQWQADLFQESFGFLVTEFGLRMAETRCDYQDAMREHRPLKYSGHRTGLTLLVLDRDLTLEPELWSRRLGIFKRRLQTGWLVRQITGTDSLVADDEARKLGRDGARRLHITRMATFVRRELGEFFGGDDRLLRDGNTFRRAYWRSEQGRAEARGGGPRMRAHLEKAIKQSSDGDG